MERLVTVKGTGRYTAKPDIILLTMNLWSENLSYKKAASDAAEQLERLRGALVSQGFKKEELKTTGFSVDSRYENKREPDGSFKSVFAGYRVSHGLKLEFDLDTALLSKTLEAIASSAGEPELNIVFGIKDKEKAKASLLENAVKNARERAEILVKASGEKLGQLMSIDYNWGELSFVSRTNYKMEQRCLAEASSGSMDIEPDDIDVSDNVTLVWELA